MPIPAIAAAVAGATALGSAAAGVYGANKAAGATKKAAKGQLGLARDQFNHMDALQEELYGDQSKDIETGYDKNNALAVAARNASMAQAARLQASGTAGARTAYNQGKNYVTSLRDQSLAGLTADRTANIEAIRSAMSNNAVGLRAAESANIAGYEGARDKSIAGIESARDANIAGYESARDKSIAGFQPYYDTGTNALGAAAYNLGVGSKPTGYTGLELSPGAKFLLDQGRDEVEGGAASAGGLYSGNTLAELEKLRSGTVATDRDNQMSQLLSLAGMGQSAAGSIADLRTGAAGSIAGERTGAAGSIAGLRTGAAEDIAGQRNTTQSAIDANRQWGVGAVTSARDYNTTQQNNVLGQYAQGMTGLSDSLYSRNYGANSDYANAMTAAIGGYGNQAINSTNNWLSGLSAARNSRANLLSSASQNYTGTASSALNAIGQAGYRSAVDTTNSILGGIKNGLGVYTSLGGQFGQGSTPMVWQW